MKRILYSLLGLIRDILNLPLILFLSLGNTYAKFLKLADWRNHNNFWPEILNKKIDESKDKIYYSRNSNKFIEFYTPSKIAGYRVKSFLKRSQKLLHG